jgi:hypothetical protein
MTGKQRGNLTERAIHSAWFGTATSWRNEFRAPGKQKPAKGEPLAG